MGIAPPTAPPQRAPFQGGRVEGRGKQYLPSCSRGGVARASTPGWSRNLLMQSLGDAVTTTCCFLPVTSSLRHPITATGYAHGATGASPLIVVRCITRR